MSKKKSKRVHTKEFKLDAVKLVLEQGATQTEAARNLGLAQSVLGRWVRQYRESGNGSFPGRGRLLPEDERVRKLERDLRRVTMERDILKKTIAYFAEVPK